MDLKNTKRFEKTPSVSSVGLPAPLVAKIFFIVLVFAILATSLLLYLDGKLWALIIAPMTAAILWALDLIERKLRPITSPASIVQPHFSAALGILTFVSFAVGLPTLHIYFLTDDFALIHAFHNLSPSQFLQLLHMDTRQFVSGFGRQEFRPLYSLFYLAAYHLWGLRIWGYHLCEILIHAFVSVLVYLIANSLAPGNARRALLAAILFTVQPPHAQALSLIVGIVAECLPAVLYLSSFLLFVCFRLSGRFHNLAFSIAAFAAGLLTKESAITLPLLIVSYDLLRFFIESPQPRLAKVGVTIRGQNYLLPYLPYFVMLLGYLLWRRTVLSSYLRESNWEAHTPAVASVASRGFWQIVLHRASHVGQLQAFEFHSLFPYSVLTLGLLLGILFLWAFVLFRDRERSFRTVGLGLCVGMAWYAITNLPFLIEVPVLYHLYLPAVGFCISIACIALPENSVPLKSMKAAVLLPIAFFVFVSINQVWRGEEEYRRLGNMSERMTQQLSSSLSVLPKGDLILIWPDASRLVESGWGEGIVPFAFQPPFTKNDLSANQRIIEHPDMSDSGVGVWWPGVAQILAQEEALSPKDQMTIHSLSWNESSETFVLSSRTMPRQLFNDTVNSSLGGSPLSLDSIEDYKAIDLVESLRNLAAESPQAINKGLSK